MTIYDVLLYNLKIDPELKRPVYITQIKFLHSSNWETRRRQYRTSLHEMGYEKKPKGGKYIILNSDINDLSITIITDDDKIATQSFIKQPDCCRTLQLSGKQIDTLWDMIQKEIPFNDVKTQAIQQLENFHMMWKKELLGVHSMDFYDRFINIINETQIRLGKLACGRSLADFCDRLNSVTSEYSYEEDDEEHDNL